jgi:hypothetical protein
MMATEDYFDVYDEPDDWDEEKEARCKFCGERDLWWRMTKNGWRLCTDDEQIHSCPAASADEFDTT